MQACLAQSTVREQEGPGTRTHREGGGGRLPQGWRGDHGEDAGVEKEQPCSQSCQKGGRGPEDLRAGGGSLHRQGQGLLSPVLLPGRGAPAGEAPLKYNRLWFPCSLLCAGPWA